jgi:hypothetical protein
MDNNIQQEYSDKIDDLTYKLYKIEMKLRKIEDHSKDKWNIIYEPLLHSDIDDRYIRFRTYDEYYIYTINKNKYKKLMDSKNVIETELHFLYNQLKELEPKCEYMASMEQ